MNAVTDIRALYREEFKRLDPLLPGAGIPWLHVWRTRAFEQFMESGFPSTKNEEWKYTDVRPIAGRRFVVPSRPGAVAPVTLPRIDVDGPMLVFVDGRYSAALSDVGALPRGVRIASLAQALSTNAEEVEPWIARYSGFARDGFGALNAALMQDGAFVHISRGVTLDQPIQLVFVATGEPDSCAYVRNILVAEPGSRATIIENYAGHGDGPLLTNAVTEVVTQAGATLEHYRLEREADTTFHIGSTHVHQERASRYESHSVTLGGRIARHELACTLDGEGATCNLNGLYAGSGRQHLEHAIRIDHHVPHCTSREWYRGILDQHARGVFSGRVVVHPQAQRTDAEQANHNLLLSEHAEADSRPQFEIYADNVKCAHGSTTGSLDPDALFYLRSRGIERNFAHQLLVYAFASDVLTRMSLAPVRALLERHFAARWMPQDPLWRTAP